MCSLACASSRSSAAMCAAPVDDDLPRRARVASGGAATATSWKLTSSTAWLPSVSGNARTLRLTGCGLPSTLMSTLRLSVDTPCAAA